MLRVTNNMIAENLKRYISTNLNSLEKIEEQIATTKKINRPSDDPAGVVRSLRLRTDMVENEQYIANIEDSISFLDTTDSAFNNLNTALGRIRELMVQAANGTNSTSSMDAINSEIAQLTEQIKTVANSTYGSKYIFAGSNVTQAPCTDAGWTGNSNDLLREIGVGVTMPVNVDMKDWFWGAGISTSGANPSTGPIVAGADSFQICVDGDTTGPHTITLTTGISGGAAIAADMQTRIQALGGVYNGVTVSFTNGRYVVKSGTVGTNSEVKITAAASGDVTSALKIGDSIGAGRSVSGASPSTDLTAGSDNQFLISVDGGAAQTVTLNLANCDTGEHTAQEMQTQIQALGGVYAGVTVSYTTDGRYVITSGTSGENSSVEVTNSASNNVADDLKIGAANGGTETSNTYNGGIESSSIFNVLKQVSNAISAGDYETVDSLLGNMDLKLDEMQTTWSVVGARTNRLEMQKTRLESNQEAYTGLLSANEDADLAELAISLKTQQNVYNASLSVGASIIQPTLLDFLD